MCGQVSRSIVSHLVILHTSLLCCPNPLPCPCHLSTSPCHHCLHLTTSPCHCFSPCHCCLTPHHCHLTPHQCHLVAVAPHTVTTSDLTITTTVAFTSPPPLLAPSGCHCHHSHHLHLIHLLACDAMPTIPSFTWVACLSTCLSCHSHEHMQADEWVCMWAGEQTEHVGEWVNVN